MTELKYNWLPHLNGKAIVPSAARGDKLSMYSIALEGWRRGLELTFYSHKRGNKIEVTYSLRNNEKVHHFAVSKGDLVTPQTMKIAKSKILTKEKLINAEVPVPRGKEFSEGSTDDEILQRSSTLNFPIVLKPTNGNLGKGVIAGINTLEELSDSLKYVRGELGFKDVIVEEFVEGDEYRVYVVKGEVIAATNRVPANIIGDGVSTVKELIEKKNKERKRNPNLSSRLIKVDKELIRNLDQGGYSLESILGKNAQFYLRRTSNISTGGDPIDVTDDLTNNIKDIATRACETIGLIQGGIDIIVNKEKDTGYVIEANTRAGIGMHLFPMVGEARDIPSFIIDCYFPETKNNKKNNSKKQQLLYFDFETIFQKLNDRTLEEIKVPSIYSETLMFKSILIQGDVCKANYYRWLKRKAQKLDISGSLERKSPNEIHLVTVGKKKDVEGLVEIIQTEEPTNIEIDDVEVSSWSKPVKIGFELIKENNNIKKIEQNLRNEQKINFQMKKEYLEDIAKLRNQKKKAEKKYNSVIKSKTWRYTSPIRKFAKKMLNLVK
ncbi:ATP-grasp domain-containing protein [Bacillus sp. H-16]|uniref:acylphosphatase n=1 Tax=Alteribacter salitolerans TaxID=2912333 RepID=UPI001963C48B|nr:acylphosphatase [Alteribacter salitolerans]MBM7095815.1 ATP-grasp domain-containing protein [Alteribacter salitolerans]